MASEGASVAAAALAADRWSARARKKQSGRVTRTVDDMGVSKIEVHLISTQNNGISHISTPT